MNAETNENANAFTVLLMSKIGAMIGLGCGSLTLGMLPLMVARCGLKQKQKRRRRRGISSANSSSSTSTSASNASSFESASAADTQGLPTSLLLCFGGGVLLFTTFLHLAPEVRASVEIHQSNGQLPTLGSLSLAELLFCGGFFLVYLVEETVHAALTGKPESSEDLLYRTVSVRRCKNQTGASVTGSSITVSTTTTTRSTWKDENDEDELDGVGTDDRKCRFRSNELPSGKDETTNSVVLPAVFVLSPSSALSNNVHRENSHRSDPELAGHHEHVHSHTGISKNASVQGLLTVLALSFHAIFEGLAVGLEPQIASVVYLAAAIATHKLVISFCVGMELYVAGASSRTTLGYLTIFSMVTPIGIALGLALSYFKNDSDTLGPTPTILQGMAAGTLLYVVFFEVLARERANEKSGLLQLAAIIVGFTLMLSLQIATAHSHSHGGHGHSHGHKEHEDHDHEHEHHHDETTDKLLTGTVDRVTESIADAVSRALTSSTTHSHHRDIHETTRIPT